MNIDVSSVTSHFTNPQDGFTTTTSGPVSSAASSVGLNSVGNYSNGDVVVLIIDPEDSNKKQVLTGTIDTAGTQVTNVVWVGGTNQSHSTGATVVDYYDAAHVKMTTKGIRVEHEQDGTHSKSLITSRTEDTSPATGDYLMTSDVSASNALKKVTVASLITTLFANIPDGSITADDLASSSVTPTKLDLTTSTDANGWSIYAPNHIWVKRFTYSVVDWTSGTEQTLITTSALPTGLSNLGSCFMITDITVSQFVSAVVGRLQVSSTPSSASNINYLARNVSGGTLSGTTTGNITVMIMK